MLINFIIFKLMTNELINTIHTGHLISITVVWLPNSTNPANEGVTNDFFKAFYVVVKSRTSKQSHYRRLTMEKGKKLSRGTERSRDKDMGKGSWGFPNHCCDLAPFTPLHFMRHLWISNNKLSHLNLAPTGICGLE